MSACGEYPSAPLQQVVLDKDGDLFLQVCNEPFFEHEPVEFQVCSATLRRCSMVWKAMLFGSFREAKPTLDAFSDDPADKPWVIKLPEDDPTPMGIVLGIAHCKFDRVPKAMDVAEIHACLVVMNKYDMRHLIQPWAPAWNETAWLVSDQGQDATPRDLALAASIAWELGDERLLSLLLTKLALESSLDDDNSRLIFNLSEESFGTALSQEMLEWIFNARDLFIKQQLSIFKANIDRLSNPEKYRHTANSSFSTDCPGQSLCSIKVLGLIWQQFRAEWSIDPYQLSTKQYLSPKELASELARIMTFSGPMADAIFSGEHGACKPVVGRYVQNVVAHSDVRVPEDAVSRMASNRAIVGLPELEQHLRESVVAYFGHIVLSKRFYGDSPDEPAD